VVGVQEFRAETKPLKVVGRVERMKTRRERRMALIQDLLSQCRQTAGRRGLLVARKIIIASCIVATTL